MDFDEFNQIITDSWPDIYSEVYQRNQENIRIKKEKTAIKNFEKIFNAVFEITYTKGFQAMSMRDLSSETGLSMGALYGYFSSKDELLGIIQRQGRTMVKRVLADFSEMEEDPVDKLSSAIKAHIFLSELARPWFFFTFMEARNLNEEELKAVLFMESYTENVLMEILELGEKKGVFKKGNHTLTASLIKSMQQDWYLKRWKYAKRRITVDEYANGVVEFVKSHCLI